VIDCTLAYDTTTIPPSNLIDFEVTVLGDYAYDLDSQHLDFRATSDDQSFTIKDIGSSAPRTNHGLLGYENCGSSSLRLTVVNDETGLSTTYPPAVDLLEVDNRMDFLTVTVKTSQVTSDESYTVTVTIISSLTYPNGDLLIYTLDTPLTMNF
jgi:hypothetical protein